MPLGKKLLTIRRLCGIIKKYKCEKTPVLFNNVAAFYHSASWKKIATDEEYKSSVLTKKR